jgi:hypothetical protein
MERHLMAQSGSHEAKAEAPNLTGETQKASVLPVSTFRDGQSITRGQQYYRLIWHAPSLSNALSFPHVFIYASAPRHTHVDVAVGIHPTAVAAADHPTGQQLAIFVHQADP